MEQMVSEKNDAISVLTVTNLEHVPFFSSTKEVRMTSVEGHGFL